MVRGVPWLALLVGLVLVLASCGSRDQEPSSTTIGGLVTPGPASSLPEDASPEEVSQAILATIAALGPVLIEAVESEEGREVPEATIEFLFDLEKGLGRQTTRSPGWPTAQSSTVGNRTLHAEDLGESNPKITEVISLTGDQQPLGEGARRAGPGCDETRWDDSGESRVIHVFAAHYVSLRAATWP